jgi:excinuclease UvrABC helicase subunit UvrB
MSEFKVVSEYQPSGDLPEAIAMLAEGIERATGNRPYLALPAQARLIPWLR